MTRPKKSLHILVDNPATSLQLIFNPEYCLHLHWRFKRKRALLRSNLPGINLLSDEVIRSQAPRFAGLFHGITFELPHPLKNLRIHKHLLLFWFIIIFPAFL